MRAALYWATVLRQAGVTRIFGHPGTESIELIEAAREAGLEFILTQHEATAAFAASMTGRLTGVPGVCVVTAGPGTTNVASGVAQADMDRMPLLAVTGDHAIGERQPRHQRLSPDLYGPISRATIRLTADNIRSELPRALELTLRPPRGPVHVTFPSPEMTKEVPDTAPTAPRAAELLPLPDLTAARRMIERAERPMIITGLGVPNAGADDELLRFATSLQAPVADTPQSHGVLPSNHPLYVGIFATHRDAVVTEMANSSDLLIAVGLDSVEFLKPWSVTSPVLAIGEPGATRDPAVPAAHIIEGPLPAILDALSDAIPGGRWSDAEISGHRGLISGALMPEAERDGAERMWPQSVVACLQKAMPADGIVTVDVGSHKLLMALQWNVEQPGTFLNSSGISSMGTGLPFALAASLVHPQRAVAAVIGDGGFLMYAGELATLRRMNAHVVIVVMSDAALYSIQIKQLRRSYVPVGTGLGENVEIAGIARAFGVRAERVVGREALGAALRDGLDGDGPMVIEALIDPAGYELSQ